MDKLNSPVIIIIITIAEVTIPPELKIGEHELGKSVVNAAVNDMSVNTGQRVDRTLRYISSRCRNDDDVLNGTWLQQTIPSETNGQQ